MALTLPSLGTGLLRKFNPASLFAFGEQGAWYDPSDLTTLFQDAGATTPVTASGQPVALMRDKSGRGNHATLSNTTLDITAGLSSLVLNGTTSGGVTSAINLAATSKLTVFAGVKVNVDPGPQIIAELSADAAASNGAAALYADTGPNWVQIARGTAAVFAVHGALSAAPRTAVLSAMYDLTTPAQTLRQNGIASSVLSDATGGGNFGTHPLYIGRRAGTSFPLNGRLYSLVIRGASSSAAQIAECERYMAAKTGVAL